MLAGATIGLLVGGDAVVAGRAVFASHLAAMLLIVPLSMRLPRTSEHSAGALEVLLQWATLALVIGTVFFGAQALPLVFIIYPVLVWGALRAEPWVTALQLLVSGGAVAVLATTRGGPYLNAIAESGQPPEMAGTLLQAQAPGRRAASAPAGRRSRSAPAAAADARRTPGRSRSVPATREPPG